MNVSEFRNGKIINCPNNLTFVNIKRSYDPKNNSLIKRTIRYYVVLNW